MTLERLQLTPEHEVSGYPRLAKALIGIGFHAGSTCAVYSLDLVVSILIDEGVSPDNAATRVQDLFAGSKPTDPVLLMALPDRDDLIWAD